MADYSQNPSNKSSNMYIINELVLCTPGQQSRLRNCLCTELEIRFAVSYASQARNRFHATNAICRSDLLSYALLTRCHAHTSQIITITKHIRSLCLSIRREIKQTVITIGAYHFCQLRTYKILSNILLSRLTPYAEEIIGDHQCGF